jgi:phage-related protein
LEKPYVVQFFEKGNGSRPAEEYLRSIDKKLRAKAVRIFMMVEENGPELREPYSKHLDDGIFEIRAKVGSNLARVLYFFIVGKRVIITHGFTKKTQKTPPEEVNRAKQYRKEFMDKEGLK